MLRGESKEVPPPCVGGMVGLRDVEWGRVRKLRGESKEVPPPDVGGMVGAALRERGKTWAAGR